MKRFLFVFLGALLLTVAFWGYGYAASPELEGVLNINTADVTELQMLPGIGEATAQNIVAFREANGPFTSIDDLIKVKGIGEKRLDAVRSCVILEGKTTLRMKE
ncbi:MAG: helix-hairpin-helix domain-containing protein [Thermodesulfobacteriota bacterium]|nr:helix-hairpin-helix domain-containing protein [Thermodesulfobacteriota bacterium]